MKKSSLYLAISLVLIFLLSSFRPIQNGSQVSYPPSSIYSLEKSTFSTISTNSFSSLSIEEIKTSFELIGFVFNTIESEHIQGEYKTKKDNIRVNLDLKGSDYYLTSVQINVFSLSVTDEIAEILEHFFRVIFTNEKNAQAAMEWFKGESEKDKKSGTAIGMVQIENQLLMYGGAPGGFFVISSLDDTGVDDETYDETAIEGEIDEFKRFQVKGCVYSEDCPDSIRIYDLFSEETEFLSGSELKTTIAIEKKVKFSFGWCATSEELLTDNLESLEVIFDIDGKSVIDQAESVFYTNPKDEDHPEDEYCYGVGGIIGGWEPGLTHEIRFGNKFTKEIFDGWDSYEPYESIITYAITGEGTPEPTGVLKGHIQKMVNQEPLSGLTVYLCEMDYGYCTLFPDMKTVTKSDGSFEFASLRPGEYVILFSKTNKKALTDELVISVKQADIKCSVIFSSNQSDPECDSLPPFFGKGAVSILKGSKLSASPDGMMITSGVVHSEEFDLNIIIENSEVFSIEVLPNEVSELRLTILSD